MFDPRRQQDHSAAFDANDRHESPHEIVWNECLEGRQELWQTTLRQSALRRACGLLFLGSTIANRFPRPIT